MARNRPHRPPVTYTRRAYLAHMRTARADLQAVRDALRAYTPEGPGGPAMVHIPAEVLHDLTMQLWMIMHWLLEGPGSPTVATRRHFERTDAGPGETLIIGDAETDDD